MTQVTTRSRRLVGIGMSLGIRTWTTVAVGVVVAMAISSANVLGPSASATAASESGAGTGALPFGIPGLRALSCGSTEDCVGVAEAGAVVYTSNGGRSWSTGLLPRGPLPILDLVSCASAKHCVAMGDLQTFKGEEVLVTNNGGATWSQTLTYAGNLASASCSTADDCLAVGDTGKGGTNGATAAYSVDGGRSWTTVHVPYAVSALGGVACASKSDCVALGGAYSAYLPVTAFYTTDGGRSWTAGKSPTEPAGSDIFISSVSCSSTTVCAAVGSEEWPATGPDGVVNNIDVGIHTDNGGKSWFTSTFASPMSEPHAQPVLVDLSCSSHLSCVAVGGNGPLDGMAAFSRDGGKSWFGASVASGVAGLYAVACTTPSDCIGVGGSDTGHSATAVYTKDAGRSWS